MLGSDLKHLDEIRKRGFRPEVVGCFIYAQKILMVYKQKHDLWQLPQGGIENHESIDQAFWRELKEELSEELLASCDKNIKMIGAEEAKFFVRNLRELNSDTGKKLSMKGKKYFFIAVSTSRSQFQPTEFEDYKWLNFEEATVLAQTIVQPRKQRITLKALNLLKKKELIS
jgi:8-oxo-dGTP pyrophosphatase MutT (NUDIX family)